LTPLLDQAAETAARDDQQYDHDQAQHRQAPDHEAPDHEAPEHEAPDHEAQHRQAPDHEAHDQEAHHQSDPLPTTNDPPSPPGTGPAADGQPGSHPPSPDLPPLLADALDFILRRISGEYAIDEFGFDREFVTGVLFPLLRPLSEHWFRVDVRGAENIPDSGAALLVSNHSGTLPWDGLMTQLAVHDVTPSRRVMRPLAAELMFATPVVGDIARRAGATLAAAADAERLLSAGELVGVWPEGFKGIGKLYRDRYRLQRFGRGGFVSSAIRTGAPIIPVSVVGAEETYPMLADVSPLAKLTGMPYWPLTPTWPWLGPLGLVPLPSKWIIDFGMPVPTDIHQPSDADDPLVVLEMTDHIREIIQRTLYALLVQRGPAFG